MRRIDINLTDRRVSNRKRLTVSCLSIQYRKKTHQTAHYYNELLKEWIISLFYKFIVKKLFVFQIFRYQKVIWIYLNTQKFPNLQYFITKYTRTFIVATQRLSVDCTMYSKWSRVLGWKCRMLVILFEYFFHQSYLPGFYFKTIYSGCFALVQIIERYCSRSTVQVQLLLYTANKIP